MILGNVRVYGPDTHYPIQSEFDVVERFGKGSPAHVFFRWSRVLDQQYTALYFVTGDAHARPSYNHTREDGPFNPCPECLVRMPRADLLDYVRDLQNMIADMREDTRAREE